MSIEIIFVDGCVNSGKTTFIKKLKSVFELLSTNVNLCVIDEPIERECTPDIVENIGYPSLFNFIASRKTTLLKNTVLRMSAEMEYSNSLNVIIVERSFAGDRNVRGFYNDVDVESLYKEVLSRKYVHAHHVLIRRPNIPTTDEGRRLSHYYEEMDDAYVITNSEVGGYNLFQGAVALATYVWNTNEKKTH